MNRYSFLGILILFAASAAEANCFKNVSEFAADICADFVGLSGEVAAERYNGQLGTSLEGLIKKLAEIDGSLNVDVARARYENVLQKDVPAALQQGRECRLEVAKVFFDRICPSEHQPTIATQIEDDSDQVVVDNDGRQSSVEASNKSKPSLINPAENNQLFEIKANSAWSVCDFGNIVAFNGFRGSHGAYLNAHSAAIGPIKIPGMRNGVFSVGTPIDFGDGSKAQLVNIDFSKQKVLFIATCS